MIPSTSLIEVTSTDLSGFTKLLPYVLFFLSCFALIIYVHQLALILITIDFVKRKMYRTTKRLTETPGVSIVKPLMGVDAYLRENLTSHFSLDYPKFELLLCAHDENDPCIPLVNDLREKYPEVDARILICGDSACINPMVCNMDPGYRAAKYDLIWISTSRIRASTPILEDMVKKSQEPGVGLVHQCPYFADQPGFLGALEKVCFGCAIFRNHIALNRMGVVCFIGMSYLIKKSILDKYGGLIQYGKYMAEDFFIANTLKANGHRLVLAGYPADQHTETPSIRVYINRLVRWHRLRFRMIPWVALFFEPLIEVISNGILACLSLGYLYGWHPGYILIAHFFVWISLDYILLRSVQNSKLPFSFPVFLLAWWCRELLFYVVFFISLSNSSMIKWGKYSYRIAFGGEATRISKATKRTRLESKASSDTHLLLSSEEKNNATLHPHHHHHISTHMTVQKEQEASNHYRVRPKSTILADSNHAFLLSDCSPSDICENSQPVVKSTTAINRPYSIIHT